MMQKKYCLYLGSIIDMYVAGALVLLTFFPVGFGVFAFSANQIFPTFLIMMNGILASFFCVLCIKRNAKKLYAWGEFGSQNVSVKGLLFKSYTLEYSKIVSITIANYTHGVLNSSLGTKHFYICLSYDKFDPKYKNRINLWEINERRIKARYSPKLCEFLLQVLPQRQAKMLLKAQGELQIT